MDWGGAQSGVSLVGDQCTGTYILLPTDVRTFFSDPTLIRTLMFSTVRLDSNAIGPCYVGVGIIAWDDVNDVVPSDPPCPIFYSNLDWIIRHIAPIPQGTLAGTEITFPNSDMIFQSRAMRKLGNTKGLFLAFEISGAVAASFAVDVRFLLKE